MFCLKKNDQVVLLPSQYLNSRDLTLIIFHNYRSPQGLRGKRSAEAEPHYGGYGGYGYGHVGYGYGLPSGYAHFSGAHHYGKRSAEAEPYYGGYGYGGYGYGGYGHGYGRGYGYGHGYGYYG